nr:MAG TPA: hypothetical protein [Caudoviricetes sp.]
MSSNVIPCHKLSYLYSLLILPKTSFNMMFYQLSSCESTK